MGSSTIPLASGITVLILLLIVLSLGGLALVAFSSAGKAWAIATQESAGMQILRPSDWKGGVQESRGECGAADGEFSFWVYASATRCGVRRDQADRLVLLRQPALGVAPLTSTARLAEGRYAVWFYGAGDPGHPWVHLCAKTCVRGELPPDPAWAFIDWIEIRESQLMFLRTWNQPHGDRLYFKAVVLSASNTQPEWTP